MVQKLKLDGATNVDLDDFFEGIDYSITIQLEDSSGSLTNFTGCTFKAEFKEDIDSATADIAFSSTDIVVSGTTVTWTIAKAKTATKGGRTYFYEVEYLDTLSLTHQLMYGKAPIKNKVII